MSACALLLVGWLQIEAKEPQAELLYISSHCDTDGFASADEPGDFDGQGGAMDPGDLPQGSTIAVLSPRFGPVEFVRPPTAGDRKNMVSCRGQTLPVLTRRSHNVLLILGASHGGESMGWMRLGYKDGPEVQTPFGLSDWQGAPRLGEETAFSVGHRRGPDGKSTPDGRVRIWLQQTPVPADRELASITLPDLPQARIIGLTLAHAEQARPFPVSEASQPQGEGPVAIFHEPDFPYHPGLSDLTAQVLRDRLRAAGIGSTILGATQLGDPGELEVEKFPVLVMPHGSCFPVTAVAALRQYRTRGGAMVHTGPPFHTPLLRNPYGGWLFEGGDHYLYKQKYLGRDAPAGLAGGIAATYANFLRFVPEPVLQDWGLHSLPWSEFHRRTDFHVGMKPAGADMTRQLRGTETVPLVTVGGDRLRPYASITRHVSGELSGCLDVWTGTSGLYLDGQPAPLSLRAEVVVRSIGWVLKEKELIDEAKWKELSRPLLPPYPVAERAKPVLKPPGLQAAFPSLPAVPPTIYFTDLHGLPVMDKLLLTVAQGLLNRDESRALYLLDGPRPFEEESQPAPADSKRLRPKPERPDWAWLKSFELHGAFRSHRRLRPPEVLDMLPTRRAIVVDPEIHATLNLATMIASLEGVLVACPGQLGRYPLEVELDLRGRFQSGAEVLQWTYQHVWPRLDKQLIVICPPTLEAFPLRDYLVARKAFVAWVPSWEELGRGGCKPVEEFEVVRKILAEAAVGTPVLGAFGDAVTQGIGVDQGVQLCSAYGKPFVYLEACSNLSFSGRLRAARAPGAGPEARKLVLDESKIYLATSDPSPWVEDLRQAREEILEALGSQADDRPRAWTVPAAALGLLPFEASFLAAQGRPASLGVNGMGYAELEWFGEAFGREHVRACLLAHAEQLGSVLSQGGATYFRYARGINGRRNLGSEDGAAFPRGSVVLVPHSEIQWEPSHPLGATYTMASGAMVFHDPGHAELARLLAEGSAAERSPYRRLSPLFLHTDIRVAEALAGEGLLGNHVALVRPDELAGLYSQYQERYALSATEIVPAGAVWKYSDEGRDHGTSWRFSDYPDAEWKSGAAKLGYGDAWFGPSAATDLSYGSDPLKKHPCYYFRRRVELAADASFDLFVLEALVDDGCAVYINGKERIRHNLPAGNLSHASLAAEKTEGNAEWRWVAFPLAPDVLAPGGNTIAVEVHQHSAGSSDAGFDLRLTAYKRSRRGSATLPGQ